MPAERVSDRRRRAQEADDDRYFVVTIDPDGNEVVHSRVDRNDKNNFMFKRNVAEAVLDIARRDAKAGDRVELVRRGAVIKGFNLSVIEYGEEV